MLDHLAVIAADGARFQRLTRWGWHRYDPSGVQVEDDPYSLRPGDSYESRFLPGYQDALAEARSTVADPAF